MITAIMFISAIVQSGGVWGEIQRESHYELRADFEDTDTGRIYNESFMFKSKPSVVDTTKAINERIARLTKQIAAQGNTEAKEEVNNSLQTSKTESGGIILKYVLQFPTNIYSDFALFIKSNSWEQVALLRRLIYDYSEIIINKGLGTANDKTIEERYITLRNFIVANPEKAGEIIL